ncbi:hypothetical protein CHUAL_008132 [Chamberlinius hualienensis]
MTENVGEGVIMVLCGLPEFDVFKNQQEICNFQCFVIEYDHLLPSSIESQLILNRKKNQAEHESEWKAYRHDIYKAVEEFLARCLMNKISHSPNDNSSSSRISIIDELIKQQNYQCLPAKDRSKFIVIIDDNMYLESMRHPYYHLARKYKYGFCQIYVKCNWNCHRNELREDQSKVGEKSIKNMERKFEAPSSSHNESRKEFNYIINNNSDHYESCWKDLINLITTSIENPVLEKPDDTAMKEMSRQICSKNVVHTADQLLRKIISEIMIEDKCRLEKIQLADKGKKLNCRRLEILDNMKHGLILVPQPITDEIQQKNSASILSDFKQILKLQLTNRC